MGALNGGGFGYPVTFQIVFNAIEDITAPSQVNANEQTPPWQFKVPAGYDFFPVYCGTVSVGGPPCTAGTLTIALVDNDTDEDFKNVPTPIYTDASTAWESAIVSSGACRVPAGTSIGFYLRANASYATSLSNNSSLVIALMGYLREASTS